MAANTSVWPLLRLASPRLCARQIPRTQHRAFPRWSVNDRWSQAPFSAVARRLPSRLSRPSYARYESTQSAAATQDNVDETPEEAEKKRRKMPQLRPEGHENPRDVPRPEANERGEVPAYELTFTCKPCKTRSAHRISKHGYHNGTVLITCPNCKNRHVISDHLKIFNDSKKTFEQILREKSELLKTGVLDPDGDFEMWDDGSKTARQKDAEGIPQAGQTPA